MYHFFRTAALLLFTSLLACSSPAVVSQDAASGDRGVVPYGVEAGLDQRSVDGRPAPDGQSTGDGFGRKDAASGSQPPITFLHISDLHFGGSTTIPSTLRYLVQEVLETVNPDMFINSGDTADSGDSVSSWQAYFNIIDGKVPPYPKYLEIPGNHDVKKDGTKNFLAYTQTGLSGAGRHGQSFIDTARGPLRIIRADTSDSSVNLLNIAGVFGKDQAAELLALPDGVPASTHRVVVAHHPITGLTKLALNNGTRMEELLRHFGAELYFCGHVHLPALAWVGETLVVQAASLGKSKTLGFAIAAIDDGPVAKMVDIENGTVKWPLVMITSPANNNLADRNPHAKTHVGAVSVRALVFSKDSPASVEMRIGTGAWVAMQKHPTLKTLYEGHVTLDGLTGAQAITVRAKTAGGLSQDDMITVDVAL